MKRQQLPLLAATAALMLGAAPSSPAPMIPPVFGPGAAAFEPEIGIINSGILNAVQATVSPDQRYVTLGMQSQQSRLLALRDFSVLRQTHFGLAGIGPLQRDAKGNTLPLPQGGQYGTINPPVLVGAGAGLALRQRGMTLLVHSLPK